MKKIFAMILAFAMILSLAACGGSAPAAADAAPAAKEEAAPAAEEDAAPAAKEDAAAAEEAAEHNPVTLQVSVVEADFLDAWYDEIKPAFEEEYPWITLEDVGTGENKQTFAATRAAANDLPPVVEVVNNDVYWPMIDEGLLLDISGYEVANNLPQAYKDAFTYNGTLFGACQGAAYDTMYVNLAVLKEAGWDAVPTCWEEFIQCCEDVKATGKGVLAISGGGANATLIPMESIFVNVICNQIGADEFAKQIKEGTLKLSDYPEVVERMAQLQPYVIEGSSTNMEEDSIAIMTDGETAFAFGGNWIAATMVSGIVEATGDESLAAMVACPFNKSNEDQYIIAIPENAFGLAKVDDPDLAEARDLFYNWIWQPENFAMIQNARGNLPVLTNMTDDQIVLSPAAKSFQATTGTLATANRLADLTTAETRNSIAEVVNEFWIGSKDVTTLLDDICALWANDPRG